MSSKVAEVKVAIQRQKLWTTAVVTLCVVFLVLNVCTFYGNRKTVASMKEMHQKMLDLKVELESLKKSGAFEGQSLDAVTYSTSGEELPGIHLSLETLSSTSNKHAQEHSTDL